MANGAKLPEWRCSCGKSWTEDGAGQAGSLAWKHWQQACKDAKGYGVKNTEHVPQGLVFVEEDGSESVLVAGFNIAIAVKRGHINKNEDSGYQQRKDGRRDYSRFHETGPHSIPPDQRGNMELSDDAIDKTKSAVTDGGSGSGSGGRGPGRPPGSGKSIGDSISPLRASVPFKNIEVPLSLWVFFAHCCEVFGNEPTAEAFAEWLQFIVGRFFLEHAREMKMERIVMEVIRNSAEGGMVEDGGISADDNNEV